MVPSETKNNVTANFGGTKKSIMVFLKVVYSRMPDDRPCQGGEWGRGGGPVSAA